MLALVEPVTGFRVHRTASFLLVYSAYRFARYAVGHGINGHGGPKGADVTFQNTRAPGQAGRGPVEIAIFNMGETRADDLATYRASVLATDCMAELFNITRGSRKL